MSNNTTFSHICEVWQPENYTPPEHTPPFDEFLIEIYVTFMYIVDSPVETDDDEVESSVMSPTTYKPFRQKRAHLIQDTTSWSTISSMLSEVNVPYHLQPFMIGKISEAARSFARDKENVNLKTIPMVISIRVVVQLDELEPGLGDFYMEEDEEPADTASNDKTTCLERLRKVKVEDGCNNSYLCVVCLEEISVGTEAISMPCSHVYHGKCILDWLQRSSLCPLCRFRVLPGLDPE